MSVLDDWRDLSTGSVRIETGPYTDDERTIMRRGSVVFGVGIVALILSGDYWTVIFAMLVAGVFVRVVGGDD